MCDLNSLWNTFYLICWDPPHILIAINEYNLILTESCALLHLTAQVRDKRDTRRRSRDYCQKLASETWKSYLLVVQKQCIYMCTSLFFFYYQKQMSVIVWPWWRYSLYWGPFLLHFEFLLRSSNSLLFWQHSVAVGHTVTSQQEGSQFRSRLSRCFSVWSLHVFRLVCVDLHPHSKDSKDMQIGVRLNKDSNLTVSVNMSVCLNMASDVKILSIIS